MYNEEKKEQARKFFNYDNNIIAIAENVFDRMEENTSEELDNAINDELIYTEDQWKIIEYYFNPNDENINLYDAFENFKNDIASILEVEE
ncbi:MAG: hypothetical protein EOL95_09395 [Bacteroidia bacterium]|nr:hypothetical protein [Bacteroidia bacterium]